MNNKEINFKFISELLNNLDIIESKRGEPIKYGDSIILMHENSQKFLKYNSETKKLILSNHDSDYTLFQVEKESDILINDNLYLKSGQPLKLKVASFNDDNKNLYISLTFPIHDDLTEEKERLKFEMENNNLESPQVNRKNIRVEKFDSKQNIQKIVLGPEENDDYTEELHQNILKEKAIEDSKIWDDNINKYKKEPQVVFEEYSNMRWRFNIYSTFTNEDSLLIFGDYVNLLNFHTGGYLSVGIDPNN